MQIIHKPAVCIGGGIGVPESWIVSRNDNMTGEWFVSAHLTREAAEQRLASMLPLPWSVAKQHTYL